MYDCMIPDILEDGKEPAPQKIFIPYYPTLDYNKPL